MTTLQDRRPTGEHNGTPIIITRRRYGRKTYAWLEWWDGENWQTAGDPWPKTNIPRCDLDAILGKDN